MGYNMKTVVSLVLTGLIGIFIVMTLFNDLYSDTNSAADTLNVTMSCGADGNCTATGDNYFGTAGNLVLTGWKIVQYGLVFVVLLGFGVALFMKSIGKW